MNCEQRVSRRKLLIASATAPAASCCHPPSSRAGGIAAAQPKEYFFFANEVPDLPEARKNIETWLKRGALGIGEQKFNLPCDSNEMQALYELAQEYGVPILMHFQYEMFNTGYEHLG